MEIWVANWAWLFFSECETGNFMNNQQFTKKCLYVSKGEKFPRHHIFRCSLKMIKPVVSIPFSSAPANFSCHLLMDEKEQKCNARDESCEKRHVLRGAIRKKASRWLLTNDFPVPGYDSLPNNLRRAHCQNIFHISFPKNLLQKPQVVNTKKECCLTVAGQATRGIPLSRPQQQRATDIAVDRCWPHPCHIRTTPRRL